MARKKSRGFFRNLSSLFLPCDLREIVRDLTYNGDRSTFNRLFVSKHVVDLRFIASATVVIGMVLFAVALYLCWHAICHPWEIGGTSGPERKLTEDIKTLTEFIGALITIGGAIIAWAYQAASRRLGVVDLFAAEITSLCRTGTVIGIATNLIKKYESTSSQRASHGGDKSHATSSEGFNSEEEYFSVFNEHSEELEVLEAGVVNHVTAFYTYMKTLRDYLRQHLNTPRTPDQEFKDKFYVHLNRDDPKTPTEPDFRFEPWHATLINCVYMLFLAYEDAHRAVEDLIEYEPNYAENMILILTTELRCYEFLLKELHGIPEADGRRAVRLTDPRFPRLWQRRHDYQDLMDELESRLKDEHKRWSKLTKHLREVRGKGVDPRKSLKVTDEKKRPEDRDGVFLASWSPAFTFWDGLQDRWHDVKKEVANMPDMPLELTRTQ